MSLQLLRDKKVLVTGATGGIGKSIVELLAQNGAEIAVSATSEEKLQKLAKEIPGIKSIFPCNLNNPKSCEEMINNVIEQMSGLDILVCNAGSNKDNLSLKMSVEDFQEIININLVASFILNKFAIKFMMKQRYGRIINISSVVASMGNAGQANYTASKAGLEGMTRSLAKEVSSRNITINCVAPGFIETPMTEIMTEEQRGRIKSNIAMGSLGKPKNIADSVLFLASEMASYITGTIIHVNGGLYMA